MTATLNDLNAAVAEPKRDRYGRYLIVPRHGGKPEAYTRATTIADSLSDRFHLEQWKQRQVAIGLARRTDLVAQAATINADDKTALNKIVNEAMTAAESDAAANMGTALHAAIEAVNRDPQAAIPDMLRDDVELFRDTLDTYNIAIVRSHVEQVVVHEGIKAAGTFDLAVDIDGKRYIADLKTGKSIDLSQGSYAIQLAIYANATSYYSYATEEHADPLDVSKTKAVIIHLPAGTGECEVYWLDIKAGSAALKHAVWVRDWRKRKDLLVPYNVNERAARNAKTAAKKPAAKRTVSAPKPKPVTSNNQLADTWLQQAFDYGCTWAVHGNTSDSQERIVHTLVALAEHVDDIDMAAAICHHAMQHTEPVSVPLMWDILTMATFDNHTTIRALARIADMAYTVDGRPFVNGTIKADERLQTWMVEQLRPLIKADRQAISTTWPAGVPTPKQSTAWTVLDLEAIGKAFGLPFPPDLDADETKEDDWEDF